MQREFDLIQLQDMPKMAQQILDLLEDRNVVLLEGELGAGKTTLTQNLLSLLGAEGPFTSPTFVVAKDYQIAEKKGFKKVFHFDCYRISATDLTELSWEEIIQDQSNLVVVEWPEKIVEALPKRYLHVKISVIDEKQRKIFIKSN